MSSRAERVPIIEPKGSETKWHIFINEDWCKGCGFCYTFCPREVLEKSDQFNIHGYYPPVVKSLERCVGCRLCEALCPEFAIHVAEEEDEKGRAGGEG